MCINGLSILVAEAMRLSPMGSALFVFGKANGIDPSRYHLAVRECRWL
jgi:hypothetical protein